MRIAANVSTTGQTGTFVFSWSGCGLKTGTHEAIKTSNRIIWRFSASSTHLPRSTRWESFENRQDNEVIRSCSRLLLCDRFWPRACWYSRTRSIGLSISKGKVDKIESVVMCEDPILIAIIRRSFFNFYQVFRGELRSGSRDLDTFLSVELFIRNSKNRNITSNLMDQNL